MVMQPTRKFQCAYCQQPVERPAGAAYAKQRFCSRSCGYKFRGSQVTVPCGQCAAPVTRASRHLHSSKSGRLFCGHSCRATYGNAHKTTGTRRSKLEGWLEERLRETYPDLDLHCNRTDAIHAELDFYFPALKLAFELNGIFHYEPIYGATQLGKTQANDARKWAACLERGIELCVIDSGQFEYFKARGAEKFLIIIQEVVDRVLANRLGAGWVVASTDPTRGRTAPQEPVVPTIPPFGASVAMEQVLEWEREIAEGAITRSGIARREGCKPARVTQRMYLLLLPMGVRQMLLSRHDALGFVTAGEAIRMAKRFRSGTDNRGKFRWGTG